MGRRSRVADYTHHFTSFRFSHSPEGHHLPQKCPRSKVNYSSQLFLATSPLMHTINHRVRGHLTNFLELNQAPKESKWPLRRQIECGLMAQTMLRSDRRDSLSLLKPPLQGLDVLGGVRMLINGYSSTHV